MEVRLDFRCQVTAEVRDRGGVLKIPGVGGPLEEQQREHVALEVGRINGSPQAVGRRPQPGFEFLLRQLPALTGQGQSSRPRTFTRRSHAFILADNCTCSEQVGGGRALRILDHTVVGSLNRIGRRVHGTWRPGPGCSWTARYAEGLTFPGYLPRRHHDPPAAIICSGPPGALLTGPRAFVKGAPGARPRPVLPPGYLRQMFHIPATKPDSATRKLFGRYQRAPVVSL